MEMSFIEIAKYRFSFAATETQLEKASFDLFQDSSGF